MSQSDERLTTPQLRKKALEIGDRLQIAILDADREEEIAARLRAERDPNADPMSKEDLRRTSQIMKHVENAARLLRAAHRARRAGRQIDILLSPAKRAARRARSRPKVTPDDAVTLRLLERKRQREAENAGDGAREG